VEWETEVTTWVGRELVDVHGDKIGTVEGDSCRDTTLGPKWLIVRTGPVGAKKVLVPVDAVVSSGDHLVVPYHRNYIIGAPLVENEEALSEAEEGRLCFRYGLDQPSSGGKSAEGCGLCRRRRRAERAQQ
jgi:hypothetical protein